MGCDANVPDVLAVSIFRVKCPDDGDSRGQVLDPENGGSKG